MIVESGIVGKSDVLMCPIWPQWPHRLWKNGRTYQGSTIRGEKEKNDQKGPR